MQHPIVAIALPGHAGDDLIEEPSPGRLAQCTSHVVKGLESIGASSCHLLGYSLGGRLALHVADARPDLIRSLILESCHPGLTSGKERSDRKDTDALWAARFEREWPAVLNDWYAQEVFKSLSDRKDELVGLRSAHDGSTMAKMLIGCSLGRQVSLWDLPLSGLFIAGQKDPKYVAIGQELVAKNPGIHLQIVPESGHNVHLECPDTYLSVVKSFIQAENP